MLTCRRGCRGFALVLELLLRESLCSDIAPEALADEIHVDDECIELGAASCAFHALQHRSRSLSRAFDHDFGKQHLEELLKAAKHSASANTSGSDEICCMCHRYDYWQHKTIAFSAEDYRYGEGHDCYNECQHECAKKHGHYWGCFDEVHMIHLGLLVNNHPGFKIEHDDRPGDIC